MLLRLYCIRCSLNVACRTLYTTSSLSEGGHYRKLKGLDPCGNRYGILSETPDWSYSDGRAAPLGLKETQRREKSQQLAESVIEMMGDMKFGKENHRRKQQQKQQEQVARLSRKLTKKHQ